MVHSVGRRWTDAPRPHENPYDLTLNGLGVKLRFTWADMVIEQIKEQDLRGRRAIVLAGKNYREFLMPELMSRSMR